MIELTGEMIIKRTEIMDVVDLYSNTERIRYFANSAQIVRL